MQTRLVAFLCACSILSATSIAQEAPSAPIEGNGVYRLPFADGTTVRVFDDFTTHRPRSGIDLFATAGDKPYRVVAAAAGRIMAIQDGYSEQQSGRAAAECDNNYVWIDNEDGKGARNPRFCGIAGGTVTKATTHRVAGRMAVDFVRTALNL